jgi:hypothetical protein
MSNFTLALAVLGGLVLAGVIAHGAWNARKGRVRQADEPIHDKNIGAGADHSSRSASSGTGREGSSGSDLKDREPMEPHLDNGPLGEGDSDFGESVRQDEALDQVMAMVQQSDRKPKIDSLLDSVATISLDQEVSGEALLAVFPSTRRVGSKPIFIEGRNTGTDEWEFPGAGRRYGKIQAGVQMANRTGALTEIEFSEFVVKVQAIADALSGSAEFPEMLAEVAKARELDQFAARHDAQLSVHLFSRRVAWSAGFVQQCASRLGFVAGSLPGRMVLPSAVTGFPPLMAINFDSQAALANDLDGPGLRHVSLSLDVPQVDRQENPFASMRQIAEMLAVSMDAVVADEQGRAVSAQTLDLIEGDLQQLYDRLERRDLHAGSSLARRLFS